MKKRFLVSITGVLFLCICIWLFVPLNSNLGLPIAFKDLAAGGDAAKDHNSTISQETKMVVFFSAIAHDIVLLLQNAKGKSPDFKIEQTSFENPHFEGYRNPKCPNEYCNVMKTNEFAQKGRSYSMHNMLKSIERNSDENIQPRLIITGDIRGPRRFLGTSQQGSFFGLIMDIPRSSCILLNEEAGISSEGVPIQKDLSLLNSITQFDGDFTAQFFIESNIQPNIFEGRRFGCFASPAEYDLDKFKYTFYFEIH